jgi:hypothetical protein
MARVNLSQTSFAGGELSPRALGRTDIERYQTALRVARNCHPVVTGGLKRREGSLYVAAAVSAVMGESILIPFVQGRDLAWVLEFGNLTVRIYNADGTDTGVALATPYTIAMLTTIDWAQSEATLYLFNHAAPIQRLQRLGSGTWVLGAAPFTTLPFSEVGIAPATSLTLSLATVGAGRTVTASAASFLAGDVGRGIIYDAGIAVITGFTSTTVVTVTITRAFPSVSVPVSQWTLEGSPQTTVTPNAKDPVGASITLTASADSWRSGDVGVMVRINTGLCRITSLTSALIANATIVRELSSTVAAPALAWSIEYPVWTAALGYPRTGTVHQQRLIAAGTTRFPRTVWGSRLAEPLDFELGTADDQAFSFTIDSDEASAIAYVSAARDLMVLTQSGEYTMRSGIEKPLTPTNVRVVPESNHGCDQVRPALIGNETLFVQRAGRKLRAMGYKYDFDAYRAPDITALADHMTKGGLVWMAFQQEPDLMLWAVRTDGKFLTCTIDRDQQPSVIGWAQHETAGGVESIASIPNGDREQVWAIVRRTVNGATVRYLERFDGTFEPLHPSTTTDGPEYGCTVDCGIVVDNASGQTTFAVAHLANAQVDVVADGSPMGIFMVTAGSITLPRASKRTLIGLPFTSIGTLLTPEIGTGEGSVQGNAARTGELTMRFLDTIGARVIDAEGSTQTVPFRTFGLDVLDNAPEPFTGLMRVSKLGWQRGASELSVVQDQPLPMHLLGVMRKHTVNG